MQLKKIGSLEFTKMLIRQGGIAVSSGIGFGEGGDNYLRFALVENEHGIIQATKGIRKVIRK
jgi:alanine-synthesizing transaminase